MPNGKGFRGHSDAKTQPGKPGGHDYTSSNGQMPDFNTKGKITSEKGSYHQYGSGMETNLDEKNKQQKYLTSRGKQGQSISEFSGTHRTSKERTDNVGTTAYNSIPIDQTYKPATSQGAPTAEQITYHTQDKKVLSRD